MSLSRHQALLAGYINTYILPVSDKPLWWVGSSLEDLRAFPAAARRESGYQLRRVQRGLMPDDWKPMASVGQGVCEVRVHTDTEHRVFYVARFAEAVYVLHAFEKKARKTSKADISLGKSRLGQVRRA
ncbi:MAG: type II toxin-antitoxin system RelE/ParE family toxin, partial [Tepidiformaceae bacterium]